MKHYLVVATCVVSLLMSACSTPQGPNQTGGMLVGGLAGGLLGSQFGHGTGALVGTGIGTLAGAYIGSEVGKSMDQPPPPRYYRQDPPYRDQYRYREYPRYERPAYDDPYYRY